MLRPYAETPDHEGQEGDLTSRRRCLKEIPRTATSLATLFHEIGPSVRAEREGATRGS